MFLFPINLTWPWNFIFLQLRRQVIYYINKVFIYIANKLIIVLFNICNNSVFLTIWNFYEGQILRFDSIRCIISHKVNVYFLCFVIEICSYIDDIFYLEYFATLLVILTFLSFYAYHIFNWTSFECLCYEVKVGIRDWF